MKNKSLERSYLIKVLIFFLGLSSVQVSNAQFLWYENETEIAHLEYIESTNGNFHTGITNPDDTGINTNSIVSRFDKNNGTGSEVLFHLKTPITSLSDFSISLKAYINLATSELNDSNASLRIYLSNSSVGEAIFKQNDFSVGQEWQSIVFDFDQLEMSEAVINSGGFDVLRISFAVASNSVDAATYYLDSLYGSIDGSGHVAGWLSGSWGVTFPVFGGERLDSEVAGGYNLIAGAQEVVDNLPVAGHVITNLSYFAHSHYFTLRQNSNVDVVNEIHPALVPSIANEAIIYDVMQKFKNSGKRVILYISTNYLDRAINAGADIESAWISYYTNNFGGDEYAAYRDLIEGFVMQIKDYADGYWLDTTRELYDDGHIEDFVKMIRDTDPGCVISASPNGAYFTDENGNNILVDSDGIDDEDERAYKIVSFEAVNSYQDFTSGHVTPLGQGAPPNSWAYEEFTIPAMVDNPWSEYGDNIVLKHAWFPVRDRWHVSSANLIFGAEDAYRFAKTLKDAHAGVTFATTIDDVNNKGFMMEEEMDIMKAINDRLLSDPVPDYQPYSRPEGAFLVGDILSVNAANEELNELVLFPNVVNQDVKLSKEISSGIIYNLKGQKILEFKSRQKVFDVSMLNKGIYIFKAFTKNGAYHVFKFFKQ